MLHAKPVITILSDLGEAGRELPLLKGAIKSSLPDSNIVDISHSVVDLPVAAYLLLSAYKKFPQGTVHILSVNIYSGDSYRIILAKKDDHYFIAPDNCLLYFAFGNEIDYVGLCFEFNQRIVFSDWAVAVGSTLEQLFRTLRYNGVGSDLPFERIHLSSLHIPVRTHFRKTEIDCGILYVDRYGNVVLDISKSQFEVIDSTHNFKISIARTGEINSVSHNYSSVERDKPLCRYNDTGFLEMAINHGSMASKLNIEGASPTDLHYKKVKIFLSDKLK